VALLLLAAGLYAQGVNRLWRSAHGRRGLEAHHVASFAAGWLVLVAALMPPLDPLGAELFSAHMVQHELLMLLAAPLMVLGKPLAAWAWALPEAARAWIAPAIHSPWVARPWAALTGAPGAWILHALAIWVWHIPGLFALALTHQGVHILQHTSFLATALLFWWSLLQPRGTPLGIVLTSLFSTMLHTGALGAFMTFSPTVWYPVYGDAPAAWGLTPLEDQQLGGLIMWVPGGLVYVAAGLAMLWSAVQTRATANR
jgi:putative membrane protein